MVIAKIDCGIDGEDTLVALKRSDGSVVLELTSKDGSIERHQVEPDDTLRVASEIVGSLLPSMTSELMLISRRGSSTHITDFETTGTWAGMHADDVAAFANAVADVIGCGVNALPTTERPTPAPPPRWTPRPPPRPSPTPRPSYIMYVDRPGVKVIAALHDLNALLLPDGNVIIERPSTGIFCTITQTDTLVVSPWPHTFGTPTVETWLLRLGVSGTLGEFEWNPQTKQGVTTEDVAAFADAVARATGCKVNKAEGR